MREATRRPGAQADGEGPQSADADAAGAQAGGDGQQRRERAQMQRAHERREASADAEADAFNQRHAAEVAEFNQRTKDACVGEDGTLDAAMVREWQREHGVAPDGKVGPKTLAAAGGTKADETKDAGESDSQVARPAAARAPASPKAPADQLKAWLDFAPIHEILDLLSSWAPAPKAAGGKEGDANNAGAGGDAKKAETKDKPLPDTSGLASELSIDKFVAAAQDLESPDTWSALGDKQRAHKLVDAANQQLTAAGVTEIAYAFDAGLSKQNAGKFVHEQWKMHLFRTPFTERTLDKKTGAALADAVYHEARHAEQSFRMARLLAGQHKSFDEIHAATRIHPQAIKDAMGKPIAPDAPEAKFAQALYDDKYGAGKAHHEAAEKEARDKIKEYKVIRDRAENPHASAEEKAAAQKEREAMWPSVLAAFEAYAALVTEADALATGDRVAAKMPKDQARTP